MSGLPYFSATFHADGTAGNFLANVDGDGKIAVESVAVDTRSDAYDVLKHLDTAASMLRTVYGATVAGDFKTAQRVGTWTLYGQTQQTALYRGKLYGYEAAFAFVKVLPLARVAAEAKQLAACVDRECGD
jgi:hypothetical protein